MLLFYCLSYVWYLSLLVSIIISLIISVAVYKNINEDQLHHYEKDQITHHFHRSLKSLQQKEAVYGAVICRCLLILLC